MKKIPIYLSKIVPISFVQSFLPKSERKYSKTEYGLI